MTAESTRHRIGCNHPFGRFLGAGPLLVALALLLTACHSQTQTTVRDASIGHDDRPTEWSSRSEHQVGSAPDASASTLPDFVQGIHDTRVRHPSVPLLDGPFDEVWVLARPDRGGSPEPASRRASWSAVTPADAPHAATLLAEWRDAGDPDGARMRRIPMPLTRTEIDGSVAGPIVSATMRQRYRNPFDGVIDAVYVFPLPHDAAVSDFVMVIGERRIRGMIRERGEAERTYASARRAGHVASLLTEERPNIFTQRVANIEPRREIDVEITFYGTLAFDDGWHELAIPLVVGPRFTPDGFNPGGFNGGGFSPPTRAVVARPHGGPAEGADRNADRNEVRYLAPGESVEHRVSMRWAIDAGTEIRDLVSPSHRITTERSGSSRSVVTLAAADGTPDRDFVLRWRVGGDVPTASLVSGGGHFALTFYPPVGVTRGERVPLEVVIVVDRSGSMRGTALGQAKELANAILAQLDPTDTFTILDFSNATAAFSDRAVPATRANLTSGLRYLISLTAGGGTHMLPGLRDALSIPGDESRQRHVILLTDGYIGNEVHVLSAMSSLRGSARISAVGTGSAVNRFLITALGQIGDGTSGVVLPNESAHATGEALLARLRHPLMANPVLDAHGITLTDMHPSPLPDLHAGRPITVLGRTAHVGSATLSLTGWIGEERTSLDFSVDFDGTADATALDRLWARSRIAALSREAWCGAIEDASARIRTVALAHGLLSPYTAFVAVDAARTIDGSIERHGIVQQPVPVPSGVEHDSTIGPGGPRQ